MADDLADSAGCEGPEETPSLTAPGLVEAPEHRCDIQPHDDAPSDDSPNLIA